MEDNIFTFIVGGKAGEGVKKAGEIAAHLFMEEGLQVFLMDDYMSLIRGGHNFTVVSTANREINSQYLNADVLVVSDKRSFENHKDHLSSKGILIYNSEEIEFISGIPIPFSSMVKEYKVKGLIYGVGAVASLAASISYDKPKLLQLIEDEYPSGKEDNLKFAGEIYDMVNEKLDKPFSLPSGNKKGSFLTGNQAISLGAIAAGLDSYYAYPMTPASSILHYLASLAPDFGISVVHPESEIAVINMAIGSAFAGARSMVGTSGGGFALMTEGFSLAGMAESPILVILSMRCGPATGVPTYTEQADLNFAISAGHGDFLRIVASPTSIQQAFYLSAEMLDLVWKYQSPGILLTDKHLSESAMSVDLDPNKCAWAESKLFDGEGEYKRYLDTEDGISPLLFPPSKQLIKWNSYEHDELGITTENPEKIVLMHEKRYKKDENLIEYLKRKQTLEVIRGDIPWNIFTYGSTYMSVKEALKYGNINPTIVAPIYLSPLPVWELKEFRRDNNLVIEQSISGQFSKLLKEKAGLQIRKTIKKYDGRPFDPITLSNKIKEVIS
ncbi:MAG: 2-oxoacid:acceptor oxidoreductase subunit alpha [Candidatus Lokiarchaeota archaeon]|nr:2-oxoacid:acceptor oxidoreductase subunit alpha [Candidatus Lokiarchaeota archaeon]MBD3202618.1 2-oxoacid:acceptor oxidoreductase subunit alpha [Candidatus Lokiarchaeota archaeon]